ncbi:bifunctional folylpolyglutamate synthase/dihydrofolate synthase [Flavobacterium algicola]|uniref:bifunctional folylpolyglutamate synthase/dihydrofolate synthase n=1 Tax=Flavobacterium algicola TaxID=556529 RepID=UPI001EFDBA70|nr:folylpolyglutamate synthase/dihydrofolate synthase family protein [Flavobacterium algicola]MCG9794036.1 bifunctional folylpolyglutamate synthase/dihydrofolate synthase [Flavobacterium algicola]
MNYQETTTWMFNQLPMYQTQGATAYKEDLQNTIELIEHLDNPHHQLKCIHVAGTNGKGSTSHMLASILQEAGYKVGLYTSPHLRDYRERIKINGQEISEDFICKFIAKNKPFFESHDISFFEMSVGLAFEYFSVEQVDFAIIEVGMGGRLDATNIITPLISVITNIGLDHTQFLGNTLTSVATEKAGIIKPNIPVVIGEYTAETKPVFISKATDCKSKIYFASENIKDTYPSDLLGDYQLHNKKTVLQTISVLNEMNVLSTTIENCKVGLANVVPNTGLLGRWQQIGEHPKTICDTAHNKEGLTIVFDQIKKENYNNLHIVFGVVNDKNLDAILPLLPKKAKYYFARPNNPRGLDVTILHQKAVEMGLNGDAYSSITEAYQTVQIAAQTNDFIYVGGSTFVVAEII